MNNLQEIDALTYVHHLNTLYLDYETRFENALAMPVRGRKPGFRRKRYSPSEVTNLTPVQVKKSLPRDAQGHSRVSFNRTCAEETVVRARQSLFEVHGSLRELRPVNLEYSRKQCLTRREQYNSGPFVHEVQTLTPDDVSSSLETSSISPVTLNGVSCP
ncbi:hypothetical protein TNCV_1418091 [Trichonephila clavipes]|nr:hypothetical protein TNCV_1418091 [Trichonephila clavipes]